MSFRSNGIKIKLTAGIACMLVVSLLPKHDLNGQDPILPPSKSAHQSSDPNIVKLGLCFVHLIDDIDVPASQSGILKTVDVKIGDYVNLKDEVARVDDEIARQQLADAQARKSIAEKKSEDNTSIESGELAYEHAYHEYQREKGLVAKGAGAQTKVDQWLFEAKRALKAIQKAKNEKQLAELDKIREEVLLKTAKAQIEKHVIRTPIDGNVFEIYQPAGSWVNAGDKVLRVIRMNTLRVQGFVDASAYDRHQIAGRKVTVTATLARGRKVEFEGVVSYVGLDEHAGNRFTVWAEVKNRSEKGQWLLVPNDEVEMKILLNEKGDSTIANDSPKPEGNQFRTLPASSQFSGESSEKK